MERRNLLVVWVNKSGAHRNNFVKIIALVFLFSWSIIFPIQAQINSYQDSLAQALAESQSATEQMSLHNQLAKLFHNQDSALAYAHALTALKLAKSSQNEFETGEAYKNLGAIDAYLGYNEKAILYYDSAFYHFELAGDSSKLVAIWNNAGRQLCNTGAFERAITGYHKAENWAVYHDDRMMLLILQYNHAACLSAALNAEATIAICKKALPLAVELESWFIQSELYSLLGISYGDLKEFSKAEAAYQLAIDCIPKTEVPGTELGFTSNNPDLITNIVNNRGLLFLEQEQFEKAYNDFKLALELSKNQAVVLPNGEFYVNIGIAAKALKKWNESTAYFKEGLQRLEQSNQTMSIGETYQHMAELYHQMGQGQEAYDLLKMAHHIQDSLLSIETEKNLQELTVQYETAKVKKELADSNSQIAQQRYRFNLFKIAAVGILLLGIWGYWFYHSKQKNQLLAMQKRQVELQYGLLRAQMNPHFIFNALHAIQGFFVNQKMIQGNEFLGKFSSLIRRILDQSQLPEHSLAQELETLRLYLDIEKERLQDQLEYTISVDEQVEEAIIELPPLIFQPFVENAIWHGIGPKQEPGHIWIDLCLDEKTDHLICTIKDDGVGLKQSFIDNAEKHISKGINITQERLGDRGSIELQENPSGPGVNVKITISSGS